MTTEQPEVEIARVLVVFDEADAGHFVERGLLVVDGDGYRWDRHNADAETEHLRGGQVEYVCASMAHNEDDRRVALTEKLDGGQFVAVMVVYGPHPDRSNRIVVDLSSLAPHRSGLCLLRYWCCTTNGGTVSEWINARTGDVPMNGDFHKVLEAQQVYETDDYLAYLVAHCSRPYHDMPGVSVGALIVTAAGDKRFFLAERGIGDATGLLGTIGGPIRRGQRFMEAFRTHAVSRAGLAKEVVDSMVEGPVLACTNLSGGLDHSVDITFLVTCSSPFEASVTRSIRNPGWYSFTEIAELYERSRLGEGGAHELFAPVRNAFEGYCLFLLSGVVGETFLPMHRVPGHAPDSERGLRKSWLAAAARVHETVSDSSPFLFEEPRRRQGS